MLDKEKIRQITETCIEENNMHDKFVTEVKVSKNNVVTVVLDGDSGVKIEDCIFVSKYIESKMDRDKEDFELTVTSFGLDEYFVLPRQFKKNISQTIELINNDEERFEGVLEQATEEGVKLVTKKDKEGMNFPYTDIKKARVIIKF
ncbi:MAG: hypothetical protein IJ180_00165 [Bacteroidales bacterium]|nr:hypothetical protein [Bacteroidales bacterium]